VVAVWVVVVPLLVHLVAAVPPGRLAGGVRCALAAASRGGGRPFRTFTASWPVTARP